MFLFYNRGCSTNTEVSSFTSQITLTGPKPKTPKLDAFLVKTNKTEQEKLDKQVANMIFATNSAFRVVEHPEFIKMIEMLRPGYKPPSRVKISEELLDKVYEQEMSDCAHKMEGKSVCLSLDGWSNIHNDPIVCSSVTTAEGETFLADSFDTSGFAHTSEYLTEVAANSIKKAEDKFGCKVGSLVTDNAANVTKMRTSLSNSMPSLITYGCASHVLNLLSQDFQIPEVKEHVIQIVRYFRNNHFAAAAYKAQSGKKLVMPQDVRWNSLADCLEVYVDTWPTLLKVCEENREKIDANISAKVSNVVIKRAAEDLLAMLKPISVALDKAQRDNCNIAETVNIWKNMEESFPNLTEKKQKAAGLKNKHAVDTGPFFGEHSGCLENGPVSYSI